MADAYKRRTVKGKTSGAVSNSAIIAAGDAGLGNGFQRVVIDKAVFTASSAATVSLVNSVAHTDITPDQDVAAGQPLTLDKFKNLRSEPGEGIDLTTVGASNVSYLIEYHYVP